MDRKVFTAILLAVVVVGLVVLTFALFRPFLLAVLWATALAVVSYRPYQRLVKLLKGRRNLAAALMTLGMLAVIIAPFGALALHFLEDFGALVEELRPDALKLRFENVLKHEWVQAFLSWGGGDEGDTLAWIQEKAISLAKPMMGLVTDAFGFLLRLLMGLAFVTFSLFYFYRDGPTAVRLLRELVPVSDEDRDMIFRDIQGAIVAAIRGGLVTALAQGMLGWIILFILNIPSAIVWASLIALASLIPVVGTALVWAPMAALIALEGDVARGVVLAGYGVLVIGMADNFLRPMLVGQHMEAHPLLLFFGTLGGIAMFGFAGIILGPVVVAFLIVTTRLFRREFGGGRGPAEEPTPTPPAAA